MDDMKVPWILAPDRPSRLSDFRPEANATSSRMVISTVEGPRFVAGDFRDSDQLLADARDLFARAVDELESGPR
jgi:hypothetical protein